MGRVYGFEREPYTRELEVTVLQVAEKSGRFHAVLDDTILYPEGGGQPSDRGWLDAVPVTEVIKADTGPVHVLGSKVGPGPATLVLDWDRRYDHMQQHTAQHLLTRVALDRFDWATRSFHIGQQLSDIELDCPPPDLSAIEALEDAVASLIVENRPIRCYRVSAAELEQLEVRSRGLPAGHTGDLRLVEIRDFDRNTCGGTHVRSTGEVEMLKIVGAEPLRGGSRLSWVAGKRVRRRLAAHEGRLKTLRGLLDTGDSDLVSGLELRIEQLAGERRARRALESRLAEAIAGDLLARDASLVDHHFDPTEAPLTRQVAEIFAREAGARAALLTADLEEGSSFALAVGESAEVNARELGLQLAETLGGRGGGSGGVFQGKTGSLAGRERALALLRRALDRS